MVPASQPIHRSLDSVTQASTRRPAEPIVRRGGLHGHGGQVARPRGCESRLVGRARGLGHQRVQLQGAVVIPVPMLNLRPPPPPPPAPANPPPTSPTHPTSPALPPPPTP